MKQRDSNSTVNAPVSRGKAGSARVYALDKTEVEGEADVVEGTLLVSGKLTKFLIDPGSTHSFVRPRFMKELKLKSESLPYVVEVSTPTGKQTLETDKIYRNCDVMIVDRLFLVDLIFLSIHGYDVILGMDWLAKYYVQIDCRTKDVSSCIPEEPFLKLNFNKPQKPAG